MRVLERIEEETCQVPIVPLSTRTGPTRTPANRIIRGSGSGAALTPTSGAATTTASCGLAPARGGSVAADVAAVLAEHHPVWSWQLSRLVCAADGREHCPCHRNAADLYDCERLRPSPGR